MPPRNPFSIRIPPDIEAEVAKAAEEQRRSKGWIIIEVLRQWFAFRNRPPAAQLKPRKRK